MFWWALIGGALGYWLGSKDKSGARRFWYGAGTGLLVWFLFLILIMTVGTIAEVATG